MPLTQTLNTGGRMSANVAVYTATFDPASVSAASVAEQDITVTGVKAGDVVLSVSKPTLTAGLTLGNARVKSAGTVAVQFVNPTAGAVDAASETYTFVIAHLS